MACSKVLCTWLGRANILKFQHALISVLLCAVHGLASGPVHVDAHVTAVWGKNITLTCLIEVNETITQICWEKHTDKSVQTIAVHHPVYGTSFRESYQYRTIFKNLSLHDATIVIRNIGFSDSGEYICKAVTFPLGNIQSSTTMVVFVEPTVSFTKGADPLIDGENETIAARCTAATGKPAAEVNWEESFGRNETYMISYPNETITIISQYWLVPTKFVKIRNLTCVVRHPALDHDVRYSFTLDIEYGPDVSVTGYDGNWFVGRTNVHLKCNADANPPPTEVKWSRLDGNWPEGLFSINNTLHFIEPLTHNLSGTYLCKVSNKLGQKSEQKIITIIDPPVTTLLLSNQQSYPVFDIAVSSKKFNFPASTRATKQDEHFDTIIGSVIGGSFFLIFSIVLFGLFYYRWAQMFCGDYFTKNYIAPSDMHKESNIDVVHPQDSVTENIKIADNQTNNLIYKRCLQNAEYPDWKNTRSDNKCQEELDGSVNIYNNKMLPIVSPYNKKHFDKDDDFVFHTDGSLISRKEWYV